jgi:hypothetical protein
MSLKREGPRRLGRFLIPDFALFLSVSGAHILWSTSSRLHITLIFCSLPLIPELILISQHLARNCLLALAFMGGISMFCSFLAFNFRFIQEDVKCKTHFLQGEF